MKHTYSSLNTTQVGKGKLSRKRHPNDCKVCEEVELPEFLPQQLHSLWQLKCISGSSAPGSAPSVDQTKLPVLAPSFCSTRRRMTPIKERGAEEEQSDKAQLPRGLRKWLVLHMRTTVQRSSLPQLANSTNSSFLSRILWLAGKIVWRVMWKERSSCLRKPDSYTMS